MSLVDTPIFEALIVPHRSLSRTGVIAVAAAMMVSTALIAIWFWLLGAWPVAALCLAEPPLLVLLLAINQRQARASELIMLTDCQLTVIRIDSAGRRKQDSLPVAWLRVDLVAAQDIPRVVLSGYGQDCEVGAFLHEPDKRSLFEALWRALHRIRNPSFDNSQLRGG
jgi:uncharacterized membrane protein